MPNRYNAVCVQSNVHVVNENDPDCDPRAIIQKNLDRNMELVDFVAADGRHGSPKLFVFSEFCLTGVPESRRIEDYLSRCVELPGWVTEVIGERAKRYGVHIAMNTFEKDPDWPGRVFNTSFLVGPEGKVLLKYRKNNNAQSGVPKNTNPGDIYSAYVERYGGPDSLFPVAETELGRIGLMTCGDMRFAEVPRCLAINGAEVICHPTAEGGAGAASTWQAAKQVRAWDNAVYFLSANNGRTIGSIRPGDRQFGRSKIIDFEGRILAEATPGENIIVATIDLDLLREHRATISKNPIAQTRFRTYVPIFEKADTWPIDRFIDTPYETAEQMAKIQEEVREKLYTRGSLIPPRSRVGD